MKERPILFSAPMVTAILAGKKTVTRRIVDVDHASASAFKRIALMPPKANGDPIEWRPIAADGNWMPAIRPYAERGDRLWVKETHALVWPSDHAPEDVRENRVEYRADTDGKSLPAEWPAEAKDDPERPKWRPSIFMPRWASRILLDVVSVRIERVQDITEEDARAEGVDGSGPVGYIPAKVKMGYCRYDFATLWDDINGERAPWESNPWIWRVEFKRCGQ